MLLYARPVPHLTAFAPAYAAYRGCSAGRQYPGFRPDCVYAEAIADADTPL